MKLRLYLATSFIFISSVSVFAHALWIETNPVGNIEKVHEIKILYGEYGAQEFEEIDKWYSDVNKFVLWLTAPDGSKKQLEYKASDKSFTASFTPDKAGSYVLSIGHSARDIDGTMVYQFNASAVVSVNGKSEANLNPTANNELYLLPGKDAKSKYGIVTAYYKGKPAANITITVTGPSSWSKNFETDENGVVKFELLWKGSYALEGFYTTEEKGTLYDEPYEQIWRSATLKLNP